MTGRKPLPTATKRLLGRHKKEKLNDREPTPPVELPNPPAGLDAVALSVWTEFGAKLAAARVLTAMDRLALEALCRSYSQWKTHDTRIAEAGIVEGNHGPRLAPDMAAAEMWMKWLHKWLVEFGCTPSSRSRLKLPMDKCDELTDFLKVFKPA